MTLTQWEKNNWVKKHNTSPVEINNLFKLVERDVASAQENSCPDWMYNIAYNAALKLCTIILYASGYKATRQSSHYYTIQSLSEILGSHYNKTVDYLDSCRNKRNISSYDYAGATSSKEAEELVNFVIAFRKKVQNWIKD